MFSLTFSPLSPPSSPQLCPHQGGRWQQGKGGQLRLLLHWLTPTPTWRSGSRTSAGTESPHFCTSIPSFPPPPKFTQDPRPDLSDLQPPAMLCTDLQTLHPSLLHSPPNLRMWGGSGCSFDSTQIPPSGGISEHTTDLSPPLHP